ncbi:MAG: glycosyltransferase family 4 protein [Chloroflexia bacterium]
MNIGINAHLLAFSGDYRQAGLSRYIYELLLRLPAIDREHRFTGFLGGGPLPPEFLRAKPPNLKLSRSRLPTRRALVRIAWEQTALPIGAAKARLDLLLCPVNVRPFICPCPAIITVHDLIFMRYPEKYRPAKRRYLETMTTWSARHAAHVIAVSEATRQDVINLLGVDPARVSTVHNGVSEQFKLLPRDETETFKHGKGLAGRVVLYLGTLEPRKNLVTLLEAFAALAREPGYDDVSLLIGGSKGWYYHEVFARAEQLGLAAEGRVRFLGRVPDAELPLWYNIADIFAYPSLHEGFGLPALEAMACGTPVIASDTSSIPEVVGDAGVLVDPSDTGAWCAALGRLLADTEAAAGLGAKGRRRAQSFSWERAARETAEVYRRVLSRLAG